MLFNSLEYLVFLPISWIAFWSAPSHWRVHVLLVASYVFYASWSVPYAAMIFGLVCVGGWLVGIPGAVYQWKKNSPIIRELGFVRYGIVATLFMIMSGVVVKMFLRHHFNIKYILVIPNILNV